MSPNSLKRFYYRRYIGAAHNITLCACIGAGTSVSPQYLLTPLVLMPLQTVIIEVYSFGKSEDSLYE
jgi:hypothetical protein